MNLSEFDYYLPQELIAQDPLPERQNSRLLISKGNKISHKTFKECIKYIGKGDVLVLNNTKVIPARLYGKKIPTEGKVEILLVEEIKQKTWKCLTKPSKRVKPGSEILFNNLLKGTITGRNEDGTRTIEFPDDNYREILLRTGDMPLPPYIKKKLKDKDRYQTIYSKIPGSIAAPTAGLHFTGDLLETLENNGVIIVYLTLHVGLGTFRPVKCERIENHIMEKEFINIPVETAEKINQAKSEGGKIIAVGTTSVRALETSADKDGIINSMTEKTDKFIYPGYKFKAVDALITNFHLPCSTLFMLVCAFKGTEKIKHIYKEAIEEKYRFYSFGDACFLL